MLTGIGSLGFSIIKTGAINKNMLMATSLAEDVMEQLRSIPYSEVKQKLSEGEVTLTGFYSSSSPSPLGNFPQVDKDSSKIKRLSLSGDGKLMEVAVEIKWKEAGRSDERIYRVATYFLEGGLNDYLATTPSPTP